MNEAESVVFVTSIVVLAGLAILWMGMQSRRQTREMEHRERLAMIQRGLVPPPEVDPVAFEQHFTPARTSESVSVSRSRSAGVMMIGLGFAFMFLLSFTAGEAGVGIGIGGAFALLGAAFFVNATLMSRSAPQAPQYPARPPTFRRTDPRDPPADAPLP